MAAVLCALPLAAAFQASPAFAEDPAPVLEPTPALPPTDPNPDPAPPPTAAKPKPAAGTTAPARAAPARRKPAPTVEVAAPRTTRRASVRAIAPTRVRAPIQRPPILAMKPKPRSSAHESAAPRPRPRRELPVASLPPGRAISRLGAHPTGDGRIDATWPAMFVLGAALAAVAAAAASAAAPSFRFALAGGLVGGPTRLPHQPLPKPGRSEQRRARRTRAPKSTGVRPALPTPARAAPPPEEGAVEIAWFRGYVKSRFYVLLEASDGSQRLVEGPWFAWRKAEPPPPPLPEIVAARDALLAKLEREGWEECGRGQDWYSQRVTPRRWR